MSHLHQTSHGDPAHDLDVVLRSPDLFSILD
jgi:hypothetical protein